METIKIGEIMNTQKNEPLFAKPVKIIIVAAIIVTLGLIIEAFINNSNAIETRKNLYEMNK